MPREAHGREPEAVISVSLGRSTATMPVTAREYALGFAVPNFLFHVATAYDILRREACRSARRTSSGRWAERTSASEARHGGLGAFTNRGGQVAQLRALETLGVEVGRVEPAVVGRA